VVKMKLDVVDIEGMIKTFIDSSFKKLRSSEKAFQVLQHFKEIKSREAIERQMSEKFSDIVRQFLKELRESQDIFQAQRANPPINRNMPDVAGKIQWSRALFGRVKRVMIKLQTHPGMQVTEEGSLSSQKYIAFGKEVRSFEQELFKGWCAFVDEKGTSFLKRNLLKKTGERSHSHRF